MRKNKGFTLVELLAVIVILAVIALIATPTVLKMIEDARAGAARSSMFSYVDQMEKQIVVELTRDTTKDYSGKYTIDGKTVAGKETFTLDIKGDSPVKDDNNYINVDEQGNVTAAELKFGAYYVSYSVNANGKGEACENKTGFDKNTCRATVAESNPS